MDDARTTPQVAASLSPSASSTCGSDEAAEGGREGRLSYDLFPAAPVAVRRMDGWKGRVKLVKVGYAAAEGVAREGRTDGRTTVRWRAIQRHFLHPRWRLSSRGKSPDLASKLSVSQSTNQPTVRRCGRFHRHDSRCHRHTTVGSRKKRCVACEGAKNI